MIQDKLKKINDHSPVIEQRKVSGGDINHAYYVRTDENEYFVKANVNVPSSFFEVEAFGLDTVRQTNTIDVPNVYYYDTDPNQTMYLIMEWIEGEKNTNTDEQLGRNLAAMHLAESAGSYGLDRHSFVGTLLQENQWYRSWSDYYREKRLLPQLEIGKERGYMSTKRLKNLEKLIERLDDFIPKQPPASLLHGDLWAGNWMIGPRGIPYLIDPSIVYGDPIFELAMTELFGGFSPVFYRAYQELLPLPDDYEDRKPIYQLFYLLVHLNLFGETYGPSVDRILKRYD